MLLIQIMAFAVLLVLEAIVAKFQYVQGVQGELALMFAAFLLSLFFILMVSPFVLAAYALYWYFAHPSDAFTLAATGAGGALVLKALAILCNAAVIPACKAIFGKRL